MICAVTARVSAKPSPTVDSKYDDASNRSTPRSA